jgi:hypothetical protein
VLVPDVSECERLPRIQRIEPQGTE